jgi:Rieske Fe-S protein
MDVLDQNDGPRGRLVQCRPGVNRFVAAIVVLHMNSELFTRRNILAAGAATAGAVTVAACGSSQDSGSGQSGQPQAISSAPLAALADIPVGQAMPSKTPDGQDVIIARPAENTAAAFSAKCTHLGCKVVPQGSELHCPCHQSVFDAMTGAVRKGPAKEPLAPLPVQVMNGQVVTD